VAEEAGMRKPVDRDGLTATRRIPGYPGALLLTLLFSLLHGALFAQTAGALRGSVVDLEGQPLAGVTVEVSSEGQPLAGVTVEVSSDQPFVAPLATITDAAGGFRVPSLPAGRDYRVRVSLPGFATVLLSDVAITAGRGTTLKVILQSESRLREQVTVSARPQIVDIDRATTEASFSSEFVDALPVFGQNYQDVLTLAAGVTDVDGDGNPNIHGARETNVVTLLDGVSTTDPLTGKVGAQLNIESIQEIELKTSGATAQFGRAQGGFTNVITKSGGNDFQGTFKMFWRGSALDGDGAGTTDPILHGGLGESGLRDLDFNDFMPFLAVGGPIVRDHAWFYAALEYISIEKPVNALSVAFVTEVREHRDFVKLTWQASTNHRLTLSANYDPQQVSNQGLNSLTREETGFTLGSGGLLVALRGMSVLSPTVALETTVAHFEGTPEVTANLGPDINGNGILYSDLNRNGFFEARERDSGEDYDRDGMFDVWEDTFDDEPNGVIDYKMVPHPDNPYAFIEISEDQDGDGYLTPLGGCEGVNREDLDCDGHLDYVNEDLNANGRLEKHEDLDNDWRLDLGIEDRNHNGKLDDRPFLLPGVLLPDGRGNMSALYPYGRAAPLAPDRDYTHNQSNGIISGPYYKEFSDRRGRDTLRQDLSVFVPDFRGSHDLRFGYVLERESFRRQITSRDINLLRDAVPEKCFPPDEFQVAAGDGEDPGGAPPWVPDDGCFGGQASSTVVLLPGERALEAEANGRTGGVYLQDTYKPRPNISFGLGVRFEREMVDSNGYTFFDPHIEGAGQDRILAFLGVERGGGDVNRGNGDGIESQGLFSDPLFHDAPGGDIDAAIGFLTDPLSVAGIGRLTRHRSTIGFTLSRLGALHPGIVQGDTLDTEALTDLGISFQQPDRFVITNNNLSPRLSASWDPWANGRTKLFATWGRYYDKLFLSTVAGEQDPERIARYYRQDPDGIDLSWITYGNPYWVSTVTGGTPNHYLGGLISKAPPSITQVDRQLRTPFSDELTVGFERELAPEVALSVRYIDRRFRDQLQDIDLNHTTRSDPLSGRLEDRIGLLKSGAAGTIPTIPVPDGRPDLYIHNIFFNQVLRIGNFNEARYKAFEIELVKRLSRRWELQSSYTYSRALGDAEDYQSRLGNDPSTLESEYGYLDFDQRHVVKLNSTMFLPRDWQVGVAASWSSGLPYSIVSRFYALDNVRYQQFRTRYGYTDTEGTRRRFVPLSRNSERNNAVYDLNLRAKKSFVMGRTSAALFLEVFNVLNSDDLRIFAYDPNRRGETISGSSTIAASALQLDAERRFGRRFQVGVQLDF
jgi:hypothetical protein